MNGSKWGLKMQSEIYWSLHMIKFYQHLNKVEAISTNNEKWKIDWYGPLNSSYVIQMIFYLFAFFVPLFLRKRLHINIVKPI